MPEIERSIEVDAPPERVFAYLRDVRHLPAFFEHMTHAEPAGPGEVRVEADIFGDGVGGEAGWEVDEDARTIAWRSERPGSDYHGWLAVAERRDGSEVRLGLHMHHPDADGTVDRSLANVKRLLEA